MNTNTESKHCPCGTPIGSAVEFCWKCDPRPEVTEARQDEERDAPLVDQHSNVFGDALEAALAAGNATPDLLACYETGRRGERADFIATMHRRAHSAGFAAPSTHEPAELIGRRLTCENQPYGTFTIEIATVGEYNGFRWVAGPVVEGSETSRLFQYTSTRSIVGETRTVYGVRHHEIETGRCVRASCG